MHPRGQKSISVFLVLCSLVLCTNLYSKERRGADVIVTKKDGLQVSGELIAVKPESLLIQDEPGADISVDVAEIREIRIVKKSKFQFSIRGESNALGREVIRRGVNTMQGSVT